MAPKHYLEEELYRRFRDDPALFDFLQAGSLDGVWYWDVENPEHEWYSPRFAELFGYEPHEIPPTSAWWQDNIAPEDLPAALAAFEEHAADANRPYDQVVRYRHKKGHLVWVRCRGLIIRDDQGRPLRMLGAHTDVSELKNIEAQLRGRVADSDAGRKSAESVFEALYNTSPDMLVSVDATDASVRRCNDTLCEVIGRPRSEIVGRPIFELYHPSAHSDAMAAFQAFKRSGAVNNRELALLHKDGSRIPVLLSVRAVRDADGNVVESMSTWRDIRELKRLASLEALTEQLKRSNEDLERFAYVASHDLQEPLRMVTSYAELLATSFEGKLDAESAKYLEFVVDGANRMKQLINDVLQLSRLQAAPTPFPRVDLNDIKDEVLRVLSKSIEESGASVHSDALPKVCGVHRQLSQALQNLVANAIKFSKPGSVNVRITAEQREAMWVIGVADNGIGIDPKFHDTIFEVFRRLQARDTYEGTGIGLSIVRRVAQLHGGRAWVESEVGGGSTFYLSLPAAPDHGEP